MRETEQLCSGVLVWRTKSHILPGQRQISGSQLAARQVPGTDWPGSGWGQDLGKMDGWKDGRRSWRKEGAGPGSDSVREASPHFTHIGHFLTG